MFLWSGRQAVFVLVMIVPCAMALTHPVWQYWVPEDFSSTVYHHDDYGVGLRNAEVGGTARPPDSSTATATPAIY
jgi:hypothetical protein